MNDDNKLSRKDFIKIATLAAGALSLTTVSLSLIEGCTTSHEPGTIFFTKNEIKLVEAIVALKIPAQRNSIIRLKIFRGRYKQPFSRKWKLVHSKVKFGETDSQKISLSYCALIACRDIMEVRGMGVIRTT